LLREKNNMALLDHQVPEEARQVSTDLLQKCVGSICVVKYRDKELDVIVCGMVTSIVLPGGGLESTKIRLYQGAIEFEEIAGDAIEYIYSLSMLPGTPFPSEPDLMAPYR
jgi:hypothetical protein